MRRNVNFCSNCGKKIIE
ncbi:MAG: hypothetical protein E3J73_05205 [Candidatus Bathyarchaeum sp.]|nr:MAG: hypothetical protein E3J73_05205 [Candidatus Bathyarchaeum sp.]